MPRPGSAVAFDAQARRYSFTQKKGKSMLLKRITSFWNMHNTSHAPKDEFHLLKWLHFSRFFEGVRCWGIEFYFDGGLFGLNWFLKPYVFGYGIKGKGWRKLDKIMLRLGNRYIDIFLSQSYLKYVRDKCDRYYLPLDFYQVVESDANGVNWYELEINYCFDKGGLHKFDRGRKVKEWKASKPTKKQIYREIMLNDWRRWNTELKKDEIIEVSEYIYDEMLNCLPPRNWQGAYFEVGEPHSHENGLPIHRAFLKVKNKYYSGHPETIQALKFNRLKAA